MRLICQKLIQLAAVICLIQGASGAASGDCVAVMENVRSSQRQEALLLRIALDPKDSNAWIGIFEHSTDNDTFMKNTISQLAPFISQMPSQTRKYLLGRIAKKYPKAEKTIKENWVLMAPKRALDLWIRVLLPADEIFAAAYKRTGDAAKAYQAYFNKVQTAIIDRMQSNKSLYGHLAVGDILSFGLAARKALWDAGYRGTKTRIYFHGSVMKNLAKRGSDLDVLTLGLSEGNYGVISRPDMMVKTLMTDDPATPAFQMQRVADSRVPELDLQFSVPHDFDQEILAMAPLEPFFLEVSPQRISLLLIPSRNKDGVFTVENNEIDCNAGKNCIRYLLR